jgi:molybdopterin converting factor small subunit
VNRESTVNVEVRLLPPLSNIIGRNRIELSLKEGSTIKEVVAALLESFNNRELRPLLYDEKDQLIPAWTVFINGKQIAQLRSQKTLTKSITDGDEITFLFSMAGG